jgi:RHS repeat-associated protein
VIGARRKSKRRQSDIPSRFLTQKELDPDAVGLNSNNNRYHFRARFYLPFRGVFAQRDPLERILILGRKYPWSTYVYASQNPTQIVDPMGTVGISPTPDCKDCWTSYGYGEDFTYYLSGGRLQGGLVPVDQTDPNDPFFKGASRRAKMKAFKEATDKANEYCQKECHFDTPARYCNLPLSERGGAICIVTRSSPNWLDGFMYTLKCKAWLYLQCDPCQKGTGSGGLVPLIQLIWGGPAEAIAESAAELFEAFLESLSEEHGGEGHK